MEWFDGWQFWYWLILGFVLLIGEAIIPGIFLLWWGLAAFIVGILNSIITIPAAWDWIIFAALAVIASLAWWRYQHNKDQLEDPHTALNQRGIAMLGQQGIITDIQHNHIGRAHFGDTTWRIKGKNLQCGDIIKVISIDGITLQVEKV